MVNTGHDKAMIVNVNKNLGIPCLFNPKEFSLAKQNTWSSKPVKGANIPKLDFGGGDSATLTMQLLFDTYAEGGVNAEDVRTKYTNAIWEMMLVEPDKAHPKNTKGRPTVVYFLWGNWRSFDAVITSITQHFTLFLTDGTPVRATLDVTFRQHTDMNLFPHMEAKNYPPQNPTSGGDGGIRLRTVQEGDTLAGIAYAEYGNTSGWRTIAEANRLTEIRRLAPGTVLVIPHA